MAEKILPARLLYPESEIRERLSSLAYLIAPDYEKSDTSLVVTAVMKGGAPVAITLMQELSRLGLSTEFDFVHVSTYQDQQKVQFPRLVSGPTEIPTGDHVLLVDEIVDTGTTTHFLERVYKAYKCASVAMVTLIARTSTKERLPKLRMAIEYDQSDWLVGWGLDAGGKGRELPDIYAIPPGSSLVYVDGQPHYKRD
ncbi:MAG: phosphoribosyltransferase family protein [Candidatus Woesebacteria bacterium]